MDLPLKEFVEPFLEQAKTSDLTSGRFPKTYRGLKVVVSFGKGNVAKVPWIAFLSPGQKVSDGIYPILLLYKSRGQLVVAYGVSEVNKSQLNWNIEDVPTIDEQAKMSGGGMDKYKTSLFHSSYDINCPIPWDTVSKSLDELILTYANVLKSSSVRPANT
jgi:5-methylcytosine-specific restriction enzyme B